MKLLTNRRLATGVLAVCVFGSVFGLGGNCLNQERKKAQNVFEVGTDTSFATTLSVSAYLTNSAAYARTMLEEYKLRTGSAWENQDQMQTAMENIVLGTPSERLDDYQALVADVESLYTDFHLNVTEDALVTDFDKAYKGFKSENNKIGYDEYHQLARAFNEDAEGFPAGLVAGLWHLTELDPFDV